MAAVCVTFAAPFHITHNIADVSRGPVLQQEQDDVQVTHEGCYVDGRQTRLNTGESTTETIGQKETHIR